MKILSQFWNYLGEQQTPKVRMIHLCVLLLVIIQILISNFMHVPKETNIGMHGTNAFFSWTHFSFGLLLLVLTIALATISFYSRGIKYFFPYIWGDFTQLRQDIYTLRQRQLPLASSGGLAACVQGLGLGAMGLVLLSGTTWFILWLTDNSLASNTMSLHKTLTGLVEAYLLGHGAMGLLHFWLQQRIKT